MRFLLIVKPQEAAQRQQRFIQAHRLIRVARGLTQNVRKDDVDRMTLLLQSPPKGRRAVIPGMAMRPLSGKPWAQLNKRDLRTVRRRQQSRRVRATVERVKDYIGHRVVCLIKADYRRKFRS